MKKGSGVLLMVFEILAVLLVTYTLISIARTMASSDTVNKIIIAERITMMSNGLLAVPENAWMRFPANLSAYIEKFEDNVVLVYRSETDFAFERVRRHFVPYETTELDVEVKYEPFLYLIREAGALAVDDEEPKMVVLEKLPAVNTKDLNWKSKLIVFSPLNDGFVEFLADEMKSKGINAQQANFPETGRVAAARLLIEDIAENEIKLYYSQANEEARNKKLAFLMKDRLSSMAKVSIIGGRLYKDASVFNNVDITLVIGINPDLKKESAAISSAIYNALVDYYEK
jgi:hypothetical protein